MTAATETALQPQPLLDLQRLVVLVRRQRRMWLATALLGVLAGGLLAVLLPAQPTAVTRLLIIHEEDQPASAGALMRTDIALLETTRIAGLALQRLGVAEPAEDFLETYEAIGLTNNVLELTVSGISDADAVARAQALADTFIADHVQRAQAAVDADVKALLSQRDEAQAELADVDGQIAATTAANNREAPAELVSLYARRAELTSQISDLGRRAREASIGSPRVQTGSQIVDAPRALRSSPLRTGATNAAVGLVLGFVAGFALAAVRGVVQDRPVLRREITANLGASVIAQLRRPRRGPARLLPRTTARRRRVATTLARAVRDDHTGVSVLDLGSVRTTAELALDLAEQLATGGPVVLIDDLPGRRLRRLAAQRSGGRVTVLDGGEDAPGSASGRPRVVGVGSVAAGVAWTDLPRLGRETVLVVRTGHASTAWLHTVARQLADLQIAVIGVVLVDPDPRDRSDGTLWDGLHTALRGRAGRAPATPPQQGVNGTTVARSDDHPTEHIPRIGAAAPGATDGSSLGDHPTEVFRPIGPSAEVADQSPAGHANDPSRRWRRTDS